MLVLFLCVMIILLAALYVLTYLQIRELRFEISRQRKIKAGQGRLRVSYPVPGVEPLVSELNDLICERVLEREELERKRRGLQRQIQALSHDMRTPLTSIFGYVDLLTQCQDSAEQARYIEILSRRAAVLQSLLSNFYELSILEENAPPINPEVLRIQSILEDCLLTSYEDFAAKGIEVRPEFEQVGALMLDRGHMIRVFYNLITNCLRYGKQYLRIELKQDEEGVHLVFENGLNGEADFDPQLMFERFYRGDSSRRSVEQGSGLGLYITRLLIERQGGRIRAGRFEHSLKIFLDFPPRLVAHDV